MIYQQLHQKRKENGIKREQLATADFIQAPSSLLTRSGKLNLLLIVLKIFFNDQIIFTRCKRLQYG